MNCASPRNRKRAATIALMAIVSCFLFSCTKKKDPQTSFTRAEHALQSGDIVSADRDAEAGYQEFHNLSSEWAWKFTILRARVRRWRGLNNDVLSVLASEPASIPSKEFAVRKLRLESVAYASLHRFSEAEQKLSEAEQVCADANLLACADVLTTRGKLLMERGQYAEGERLFQRVLAMARTQGDPFTEANALLDLTWSANEQTHFDEALDRANSARVISAARGFTDIAQTALGNMGWAYYKLGDPEKAEGLFVEATKQAAELGDVIDQMRWLSASGYLELDRHNLSVAEKSFQQSLRLARQINSREDLINSLIALAFLSEQTNHLPDAQRYSDEALTMARTDGNKRDETYPRLVQ